MITLLPLNRVIVAVAVFYGCVVALVVGYVAQHSEPGSLYANVRLAAAGATGLNLALLLMIHWGWKWLWSIFPALNTLFFPNLSGTWKMKIHWVRDDQEGEVDAVAIIKQDFTKISMEVASPGSSSQTLIAQPKKDPESGRPILYYVYRVIPKRVGVRSGPPYEGAAILHFSSSSADALSGNYFTSQRTQGHFTLTRTECG